MSFTSIFFLAGLLPLIIGFYYLGRKHIQIRKLILFLADSFFYIWNGTGAFLFFLAFSFAIWLLTLLLTRKRSKVCFVLSVLVAILPLLFFKYTAFLIQNIQPLVKTPIKAPSLMMPLGVSFFTFQAVSLLSDFYHGRTSGQTDRRIPGQPANQTGISGQSECRTGRPISWLTVYLYLGFFATVTSGPIVRFQTFEDGIHNAVEKADYPQAVERIVLGFGKKMLVADKIGLLADYYFDGLANGMTYSTPGLWIGSLAYTLQLYFDFSGYSDIAIGIGRLLGFDLGENFNHPYRAKSISDFWRRWHISLSRWFRDYVYIPAGGNRCSRKRHIFNLFLVWSLTGMWHGADWTFLIWGLGYFLLLVFEKYGFSAKKIEAHWYGRLYTLFFVNLLWVPFRASNLSNALKYLGGMAGIGSGGMLEEKAVRFLPLLILAVVLCMPFERWLSKIFGRGYDVIKKAAILAIFVLSICAIANSTYAPYIYGKF